MKKFNSKILFKTGFFLGFNSKKIFKTVFFLGFNSKKYSKLFFFLDSIQKQYSKLDFSLDSIHKNIHSIKKRRNLPPLLMYDTYCQGQSVPHTRERNPLLRQRNSLLSPQSLPCTQFCHVRSPVSLDTQFYSTWTPGGPPKDPPQMVGTWAGRGGTG